MIRAIFSDVGGVLGTNGWDRPARRKTVDQFGIGWMDFADRHDLVINAFEIGHLSLDAYLDRTVFYTPRNFTRQEFQEAMFSRSEPFPETLSFFARVAESGKYLMAALNNESLELNLHRIRKFGLQKLFSVFFSSCFLGIKKPNDGIYLMALQLTQLLPEECLFIDDRSLNVERAQQMGMKTIHCQDPLRLPEQMMEIGVAG